MGMYLPLDKMMERQNAVQPRASNSTLQGLQQSQSDLNNQRNTTSPSSGIRSSNTRSGR